MNAVVFAYSAIGDRCLRVLHAAGVDVKLVVTHADHPGETIWFQRVADTASELGLPVLYAHEVSDPQLPARMAQAQPDVIFSFYFRDMLPIGLLSLAGKGAFNMHGSLLPRYRGRAPVNWAVLHGETETGATLHEMVAKPDAGAIVDQCAVPILPDDTAWQVAQKVTVAAEIVLWRSLPGIVAGGYPRRLNDIARGSYFGRRTPEDGRIDWSRPASEIYNLIRAVAPPYPGAFSDVAGRRLVVGEARLLPPDAVPAGLAPGLHVIGERIVGICGDGRAIHVRQLLCHGAQVDRAALSTLLFQRDHRGELN
ncbi:MAG TPA: formyltransferase [Burkholderiaceae bacterium]|nr:formyltransferase [Burkholderiaceae bacterium]